jgi:hypothetical protein
MAVALALYALALPSFVNAAAGDDLAREYVWPVASSTSGCNGVTGAIDGSDATCHGFAGNAAGAFYRLEFPEPVAVTHYRVYQFGSGRVASSWDLEYADFAAGPWSDAHVQTSSPGDTGVLALATPRTARYWRWLQVSATANPVHIYALELRGDWAPLTAAVDWSGMPTHPPMEGGVAELSDEDRAHITDEADKLAAVGFVAVALLSGVLVVTGLRR